MSNVFNERQQALMDTALDIKAKMLSKYDKSHLSGESISDDSIENGIALADAVERSIERNVKLNLLKEKIEVERKNGASLADAFVQLHKMRLEETQARTYEEVMEDTELKELDPELIGGALQEGELITGEDAMDYDKFRAVHYEDD